MSRSSFSILPWKVIDDDDATEDKLTPRSRPSHATPLQLGNRIIGNNVELTSTPRPGLRQLAGMIQKPSTPGFSTLAATDGQARAGMAWTPAGVSGTKGLVNISRRKNSQKGQHPTTPHTIRALQQRRQAAQTPGQNKRRSLVQHRETPRNTLRNLSKILSRTSKVFEEPLHRKANRRPRMSHDKLADDLDILQPRLSIPSSELEENDDVLSIPHSHGSAITDNDSHSERSIEVTRRALGKQRFARGRLGSLRMEDKFDDLAEIEDAFQNDQEEFSHVRHLPLDDLDRILPEDETLATGDKEAFRLALYETELEPRHKRSPESPNSAPEEVDTSFAFNLPPVIPQDHQSPKESSNRDVADRHLFECPQIEGSGPAPKSRDAVLQRGISPKVIRRSQHGTPYTSLPPAMVKKLAVALAQPPSKQKITLNPKCLGTIMQASEWFFEQVSDDLSIYSEHASRKTIDETDVVVLMKRQRLLTSQTTPFSLAQRYLPREFLQEIRMAPSSQKSCRSKHLLNSSPEVNDIG